MNEQNKNSLHPLEDTLLQEVSAGALGQSASTGLTTGFRKKNPNGTGSGTEPKFALLQTVGIQYCLASYEETCKCQVISVSSKADSGTIFPEFTYSVWVLECPSSPGEANTLLTDVQESCLREL